MRYMMLGETCETCQGTGNVPTGFTTLGERISDNLFHVTPVMGTCNTCNGAGIVGKWVQIESGQATPDNPFYVHVPNGDKAV